MKILLINSPFSEEEGITHLPLFMAYPASILEKNHHKVKVIDLAVENLTTEKTIETIKRFSPGLIVINSENTVLQVKNFYQAVKILKLLKPEFSLIPIAMMGAHVTFRDMETMKRNKEVSFIIRHSPDYILSNLAKAIESKNDPADIKGITYRMKGKIIRNKNDDNDYSLDDLPFPARHLFPIKKYLEKDTETMVQGSRGCTNHCFFCQSSAMDAKLKIRSAESLVSEIKYVLKLGFKSIFFADYDFCISRDRLLKFCDLVTKNKMKFEWACNMRADRIKEDIESEKMLEKMKQSGCYRVFMGFESVSSKVLQGSNKQITPSKLEVAAKMLKKHGISLHASFLFGLPNDNEKTIKETVEFAKTVNPEMVSFNLLTPYPGTIIGDHPERFGISISDKFWFEKPNPSNRAVCGNKNLKPEKLFELYKSAYKDFFNGNH